MPDNAEFLRGLYEPFARGGVPTVVVALDDLAVRVGQAGSRPAFLLGGLGT